MKNRKENITSKTDKKILQSGNKIRKRTREEKDGEREREKERERARESEREEKRFLDKTYEATRKEQRRAHVLRNKV